MEKRSLFKWRPFESEVILLCLRWYLRYPLSYRDLDEMLLERGVPVDHTTIYRWVQRYAPELEQRCRPCLKATTDSWRVDETYVNVKGTWMYLYRAVDSRGEHAGIPAESDPRCRGRQAVFLQSPQRAAHRVPARHHGR